MNIDLKLIGLFLIIIGVGVLTVPLHTPQVIEPERCQLEMVSQESSEGMDNFSYQNLSEREQRAFKSAISRGSSSFSCPSDPALKYAGDIESKANILYNGTSYTVITTYDDALFPYDKLNFVLYTLGGSTVAALGFYMFLKRRD